VLVSWETNVEHVARVLPSGLQPATVDGRHLVTIAALRWDGGRLGGLPLPRFSQVNVRLYVVHAGETGVFFRILRVTVSGMGGALLGLPIRPARIRVREGLVEAPGLGVRIAYQPRGPAEPSELTSHELGLFEAAGLRAFRVHRGEAAWERAEPTEPVSADPLRALGFDVSAPPSLLYAGRASFETELPAKRVPT